MAASTSAALRAFCARPAFLVLPLLLVAASACGGSGGSISDAEATDAVNAYLRTTLGLFTGTTDPQDFIDQYAPECRSEVDASSLALVSAFMQGMAPGLAGKQIEAVDVGKLKVEKIDNGALVTPEDPGALRVKVNGEFIPASEFFGEAGFVSSGDSDLATPVRLVRHDGKIYLGDCTELKDLSGGLGGS